MELTTLLFLFQAVMYVVSLGIFTVYMEYAWKNRLEPKKSEWFLKKIILTYI